MSVCVEDIRMFEKHLINEEKSRATIEKYTHDAFELYGFLNGRDCDKFLILEYKKYLSERYAVTSANSKLAAVNAFLKFCGHYDMCVKQFKIQRSAYSSEDKELTKEEYSRLVNAANAKKKERTSLIIQTICACGIRVSELKYITVESLYLGEASVRCKGKDRRVFIVQKLKNKLLRYAKSHNIKSGAVFVSRNGKPLSRYSVWREMKALCKSANVKESKVFPHNLRHLFARTFYSIEKDIAKLADILGHASINTTRIYVITTASEHKRKMENMRLIL